MDESERHRIKAEALKRQQKALLSSGKKKY